VGEVHRIARPNLITVSGVLLLLGVLILIVTHFAAGMADRKLDFWREMFWPMTIGAFFNLNAALIIRLAMHWPPTGAWPMPVCADEGPCRTTLARARRLPPSLG
jgi:hypothetical protein